MERCDGSFLAPMLCVGARSWMVPRPWSRDAAVAAWRFGERSSVQWCHPASSHAEHAE